MSVPSNILSHCSDHLDLMDIHVNLVGDSEVEKLAREVRDHPEPEPRARASVVSLSCIPAQRNSLIIN